MASYDNLAPVYDSFNMDWYTEQFGARIVAFLNQEAPGPNQVLDVGCGTGTFALYMSEQGHRVTGLDISSGQIEAAIQKDVDREITWHIADIFDYHAPTQYDLVTALCDVINHFEGLEQWSRVFKKMKELIRPGGCAILDVLTIKGLESLDGYFVQDRAGDTVSVGVIWDEARRCSTAKITTFSQHHPSGMYVRRSVVVNEWAYELSDIINTLTDVGFKEVRYLHHDDASGPGSSNRVLLIAQA